MIEAQTLHPLLQLTMTRWLERNCPEACAKLERGDGDLGIRLPDGSFATQDQIAMYMADNALAALEQTFSMLGLQPK